MNEGLVDVATFGLVWKADMAQNQLEAAGIESFLQGEHMFQMAPYATDPKGIRLQVAESDAARAREVLSRTSVAQDEKH